MVHNWFQYLMIPVPTIAQYQTSLTGQRTKEISVLQLNSSKLIKLISEISVVIKRYNLIVDTRFWYQAHMTTTGVCVPNTEI